MTFDIANKTILVTGANRGIGKTLVESFFKHGAAKVYAAVRNLDSTTTLVETYGDKVVPIQIDLGEADSITAAAQIASDVQRKRNRSLVFDNLVNKSQEFARKQVIIQHRLGIYYASIGRSVNCTLYRPNCSNTVGMP